MFTICHDFRDGSYVQFENTSKGIVFEFWGVGVKSVALDGLTFQELHPKHHEELVECGKLRAR